MPSFLPMSSAPHAPKWNGNPRSLKDWLAELDNLFGKCEVKEEGAKKEAATRYAGSDSTKDYWRTLPAYADTKETYETFKKELMKQYDMETSEYENGGLRRLKDLENDYQTVSPDRMSDLSEFLRAYKALASKLIAESLLTNASGVDRFLICLSASFRRKVLDRMESERHQLKYYSEISGAIPKATMRSEQDPYEFVRLIQVAADQAATEGAYRSSGESNKSLVKSIKEEELEAELAKVRDSLKLANKKDESKEKTIRESALMIQQLKNTELSPAQQMYNAFQQSAMAPVTMPVTNQGPGWNQQAQFAGPSNSQGQSMGYNGNAQGNQQARWDPNQAPGNLQGNRPRSFAAPRTPGWSAPPGACFHCWIQGHMIRDCAKLMDQLRDGKIILIGMRVCWKTTGEAVPKEANVPPAVQIDKLWPSVSANLQEYIDEGYLTFSYAEAPVPGMYNIPKERTELSTSFQDQYMNRTPEERERMKDEIRETNYINSGGEGASGNE